LGVALVIALAGLGGGCQIVDQAEDATAGPLRVSAVRDGDTIEVLRGGREEAVRLLQVNTPESAKPGTPIACGALEAKSALTRVLYRHPLDRDGDGLSDHGRAPRRVWLEFDPVAGRRDRYGRLLAHVHVGGREGPTLAARQLAAGWGELYVFDGQHTRLFGRYAALEREARRKRRGVWGRCGGDFHRSLTTRDRRLR
jgi:micrococcal nuclease